MTKEISWNVDGHRMLLTINKSSVDVTPSICPHGGVEGAPCFHAGIGSCVVNYFINTYGLESNHGVVAAEPSVEIAWASSGSAWEIDLVEFLMIPVNDPYFKDWHTAVTKE